MYRLYTDKSKTFTCNVDIEGASINESEARIILETRGMNILYNGKIYSDGTCEIEIDKMKFLPEDTKGKIKLEIIAENTLFIPWESDFVVETEKKVKITEVKEDVSKNNRKNNVRVMVEMDETKNVETKITDTKKLDNYHKLDTKKLNEYVSFLSNYASKNNLRNDYEKNTLFENYRIVLANRKVFLNENEVQYIIDKFNKQFI